MQKLAAALIKENQWETRKDTKRAARGSKVYYTSGWWVQLGHCNPKRDVPHIAGKGGKAGVSPILNEQLICLGEQASKLLEKYRPDITSVLKEGPNFLREYGWFHLFMSPVGVSILHQDPNDFVSFIFVIQSELGALGGLEIGDLDLVFTWKVGDAVILDSNVLYHGSRDYLGYSEGRLVGIFLIHRTYLLLHNFHSNNLQRQSYPPPKLCSQQKQNKIK
mmetsp:Transcript_9978/g.13444  ORF Transcript_9978/g.13444 Transcript_9978/m.13444 type:complete len:220 (+) Transcript_9978:385-1044(+)